MSPSVLRAAIVLLLLAIGHAPVAGQRDRIRLNPRRSTPVTAAQASELTLTTTEVAVRPVQVWVRTAGVIDGSRRVVTARVLGTDATRVRAGQRVRVFSPETRSRMYQATVSRVTQSADGATVSVTLMGSMLDESRHYLLEIVTEHGDVLSVPNEAILESGGKQIVYLQEAEGVYTPRDVIVGVRGELFTEVRQGVEPGQQVVTIGSFFIDAEHKLKGS